MPVTPRGLTRGGPTARVVAPALVLWLAVVQAAGVRPAHAQQPAAAVPRDARARGTALVTGGAALVGTGLAIAIAGGIGFGVVARRRSEEVEDVTRGGNPRGLDYAETRAIAEDGKSMEIGQIAMAAAGGAIAILGAVLIGVGLRKRSGPAIAVVPALHGRGGGIALRGSF